MKRRFKIISLILVLLLAISFSGCNGEVRDAKKHLQKTLDTLKAGDYDKVLNEYVCKKDPNKDFLGCGDNFNIDGYPAYDAQKALFNSIKYEIVSEKVLDSENIEFKLKITALDLKPIAATLEEIRETTEAHYTEKNSEKMSAEELKKNIDEAVAKEQIETINSYLDSENKTTRTSTVTVELCYGENNGGWGVHLNDELIDAVVGGVYIQYAPAIKGTR